MKKIVPICLSIIIIFAFYPSRVYAADFYFSDNFSGDFNIDKNLSNYKFTNGAITIPDNVVSARIISERLFDTSYNISSAKLEISDSFPAGGRITYYVSNDDGNTWAEASKNVFINFSSFGKKARWSAVVARTNAATASPAIHSIKITVRENLSAPTSNPKISLATKGLAGSIFDPDSYVLDNELNGVIGSNVFARIDFLRTGLNAKTNSENTSNTAGDNTGNNPQVVGASIAKVAGVSTGTAGSLALSAALSFLFALSYMAYTRTGLFKKREALAIIQKHRSDKNRFNFAP